MKQLDRKCVRDDLSHDGINLISYQEKNSYNVSPEWQQSQRMSLLKKLFKSHNFLDLELNLSQATLEILI